MAASAQSGGQGEGEDEATAESSPDLASSPAPRVRRPPVPVGMRLAEVLEGRTVRIGYSWERRFARGLGARNDDFSRDDARALGYSSTPRSRELTFHTFEIAYAPHPRTTLVMEVPFIQTELERVDQLGGRTTVDTEGVGDMAFSLVGPFIRKGNESTQIRIGFNAPTGSIRRSDDGVRLPYDSQIGNGTWDLEWGWTYEGAWDRFAWGGQATGHHPVSRNDLDYRTGSRFVTSVWGAGTIISGLSVSLRTEWEKQNNIRGDDDALDPTFDPSENPRLRGGHRITFYPGASLEVPRLNGQRIGVEFGIPVYQDINGPQLQHDWSVKTAWRWIY